MRERETFASRLGFILVAAGCAVGIGNVWKFPYICGQYGGAAFIVPIIQSYEYMDLTPISINVDLKNALSRQNIRIDVP